MPNKPRPTNPARPVRIEDELWAEVQALAAEDETTSSAVVREAVRRYVKARKRHAKGK
jgi:predicted transcriptional regulator